ncbi:MAG: hypothetical protein ABSH56_32685 [Bryobacteraceae bacterium]|jgi:hypothetical protein
MKSNIVDADRGWRVAAKMLQFANFFCLPSRQPTAKNRGSVYPRTNSTSHGDSAGRVSDHLGFFNLGFDKPRGSL